MIRNALELLMRFISPWAYQFISNIHIEEGKGSQQLITCALVILT